METRMLLKDESLWNRIQGFSLDAPDADFPFSKKLAKEENWSLDFARKAIEEYKKFVYLCCILPNGASPSKIVDKVWHLHLIYTQDYWEDFCPNILKRALHHHPSKGGFNENVKHQDWFTNTLKSYKEIFQSEAPQEIWHEQEKVSSKAKWWRILRLIPFFGFLLLLSSCLGEIRGAVTSIFFTILVIFAFGIVVNVAAKNTTHKNDKDSGSSGGSSCSGGGSSCSGGGSCGGGCGGCGGGCGG
ncbi:hypothetical protein EG347_14440 [Chryseobacterium sp. G0186]|uniref:glycine-rich domain-containing protein n=1 Tax=Chryseobacterium sp. G0186 TaxID=2487064 RepID=UPI000F50C28A|nr:hypothetical protein [Chryseobacterium sp. G0186]AZA78622.1 hypothetical protein EG347_14440 [Chryseobacterium sp. G0186]